MINDLIMKSMSFDLLEVLISVAESKNFREAAEKLHLSQPAVSIKLKELQERHPLALFQLEGKRKVLTHYGRALFEVAKNGAQFLERNIEGLHRVYASEKDLVLRIGARPEVFNFVAPYLEFDGKIQFISLTSKESTQKLLGHEIDIAISYSLPDSTEIMAKMLFQSTAHLAVHSRWLKKKALTGKLVENPLFLKETPCIFYQQDGHVIRDWVIHLGIDPAELNVRLVVEDWRTVQNLVAQGFGYAVLPEYVGASDQGVQRIGLPSDILRPYAFYALFEKSLKKVPAFQRVLTFSKLQKLD